MNTNLIQIKALRNRKIQSANVREVLAKRISQARREVASLRRFANRKPGNVADNCNKIADEIEAVINE
jgi:hypothetical protein